MFFLEISFGGIPNSSSIILMHRNQHQHTSELSGTFQNLPPEPRPAHAQELSGTFRNLHQHAPELSGTFRNLPPEPAPATRTGTHRSLSGLKTPLAYAVGEKNVGLKGLSAGAPLLDVSCCGMKTHQVHRDANKLSTGRAAPDLNAVSWHPNIVVLFAHGRQKSSDLFPTGDSRKGRHVLRRTDLKQMAAFVTAIAGWGR